MSNFKQQSFLMPVKPHSHRLTAFDKATTLFKKLHVIVILLSLLFCQNSFTQKCYIDFSEKANLDSLKKVLPSLHDSTKVDCLNALSAAYIGLPDWFVDKPLASSEFDAAEIFAQKALEEARKITYIHGIAKALSLKAEIKFEADNNYPEAEKLSREAISYYKKTINKQGLNRVYWRLGTTLHAKSDYDSAINAYDIAYDLSKKAQDSLYIIYSIITCAHVSLEGSNYTKAFEKALALHQIASKSSDSTLKYWELLLMSDLYSSFEDSATASKYYDSANKYVKPALTNVVDTSNRRALRFYLAGIGEDYLSQKKFDKALPFLLRSLTYNKQDNDVNQTMYLLLDVSKTFEGIHNTDASLKYAHEVLAIAKQKGARQNIRDAYEILSSTYDHLHKGDSAYFYYRQFTAMRDSVLNDQAKGKLAGFNFEQKIQLLNKEKEIQQAQLQKESLWRKFLITGIIAIIFIAIIIVRVIMLKRRNEAHRRALAENELQIQKLQSERTKAELQHQATELEMQALRAQMNPHFIFNSLNSINRFILQNNKAEATEYLTKFSRLIRMILNSSANATVSLAEDIEALQLYLELERLRCEEKFSFKIKCDPDLDVDFIQVPPMLLQPFVENSIWHGLMNKEGEGHLSINIQQEDSSLLCAITDDGIGRKKAIELRDSSGKHKSMGMKITESRIAMMQKMNGENKSVEIRDLVDADGSAAGTEVIIKMPVIEKINE